MQTSDKLSVRLRANITEMSANGQLMNIAVLALLGLIWGTSFLMIKTGLAAFPAHVAGALRPIVTGLVLIPFAIRYLFAFRRKNWKFVALSGLLGSVIPAFMFAAAQTHIPSGVTGVLNSTVPLITFILGVSFFGTSFRLSRMLGVITAFAGAVLLVYGSNGDSMTGAGNDWVYSFFVLGATICYALNIYLVKLYLKDEKPLVVTAVSFQFPLPFLIAYVLTATDFVHILETQTALAMQSLGAIAYLGIVATALASVLYYWLIRRVTPLFASSVTYLIPVVALMWGTFYDEPFTWAFHVPGAALILLGVYITNRAK